MVHSAILRDLQPQNCSFPQAFLYAHVFDTRTKGHTQDEGPDARSGRRLSLHSVCPRGLCLGRQGLHTGYLQAVSGWAFHQSALQYSGLSSLIY